MVELFSLGSRSEGFLAWQEEIISLPNQMLNSMMISLVMISVLWGGFDIVWNLRLLLPLNFAKHLNRFGTFLPSNFPIKVTFLEYISCTNRSLLFSRVVIPFQTITVALRTCGINYCNIVPLLWI